MKQTKYKNKKTVFQGITFDSKKEAQRYAELLILQRAGKIKNLELQKPFVLIPVQYETYERRGKDGKRLKDGKRCAEQSCVYKADFCYTDENGRFIVEDAKGKRTKEYIIKRKLMLFVHHIKVKEV